MSTLIQRSFSGGEITPSLYARVDISKYAYGLRTLRNFFVMRHGGASNRSGTEFAAEVKDSTKQVRLVPFVFNNDQTYVLEFGDLYMRVIKDGSQVFSSSLVITGATNANPCEITSVAHGLTTGQEVYISGIVGAIGNYLNNRNFKVVNTGANTFTLQYLDGSAVNSTAFGAYTSGGTAQVVYEIVTTYVEADLQDLKFVQSADVITIVGSNYPPADLSRTGDAAWSLDNITFAPAISAPTDIVNSGPSQTVRTITAVSLATPAKITTSVAHLYATGDEVQISGMAFALYGVNPRVPTKFKITVTSATEFTIKYLASNTNYTRPSNYTANSGRCIRTFIFGGASTWAAEWAVSAVAETTFEESEVSESTGTTTVPSIGTPITISWTEVTGAQGYNVYKRTNGIWGFIGYTERPSFIDTGITADETDTPPVVKQPFNEVGQYPSAITYYQQRKVFANTTNEPEKIFATKTGLFTNLTVSNPIKDDDAVTFTMAGRQVNEVRHMVDIGKLIVFTAAGEWAINGDSAGILLPGEVNPKQYSYNGSNDTISPIVIDNSILYVQARGSIIRDLGFNFESDGYSGNDLTIYSAHLFDNYQLVDMAFQQIPHSILWVIRDDGSLLGLTYVKEQQMAAWHHHDTDGLYERVCVVPEGARDVLYVVVKRTIGGVTKRYIERIATRNIDDVIDSTFLDSYLSYDGRHTGSTTMTLSGSGWTYTDTLTLTASASTFSATDVGNQIHLTGSDGTLIRATITAYTSATVVSVTPNKTVPASMQAIAIATWASAVDNLTGLWHLEGKSVSVFADRFVVANPNNTAYDVVTVTNGAITLDKPYSVIHVGLPYTSDLETLNIDTAQGETIADKKSIVTKVSLFVEDSRGVWVGAKPPPDEATDFLGGLTEIKVRNDEPYDSPVALSTGVIDVNIKSEWSSNGRIFIRQTDPIPLAVLAVAPAGLFAFRG